MISYTKLNVLTISFFITVIIFFPLNYILSLEKISYSNTNDNEDIINLSKSINNKSVWQLEIPKINLIAPIQDGIDSKTMNKYIGHFPTTSKNNGNIGLAAHNRRFSSKLF